MASPLVKEVQCPSGAILKIYLARFEDARLLYQALLKTLKDVQISIDNMDMANLYKDLFCTGFSSPEIEGALWRCFDKCLYNAGKGDAKLTKDSFEPLEAREDYITVCTEVAKENVTPFLKSLYAQFQQISPKKKDTPA